MVFGLLFGFLFAIMTIAGILLACYFAYKFYAGTDRGSKEEKRCGILRLAMIPVAIAGFVLFLFIPFSWHTIDTGEIAVVKHLGEARDTRTAGTYFDFWMTESYQRYDIKVQNLNITTQAYSKDAQTMDINMTVQYQIKADKVLEVAKQYGTLDVLENRIGSVSVERTKAALSKYSAMEVIETRSQISPEVEVVIKDAINENYYVDIVTVVLTNIDFSDAFEKTVEDKMIAEQEKLKAEYEKEKAIIQAEQELEVAKLEAQARLAKAQGDADAQKVIADAEAYATQIKILELARVLGYKVNETPITEEKEVVDDEGEKTTETVIVGYKYDIEWGEDEEGKELVMSYLKYLEYLSKWNGKLPDVVAGDDLSIFIPSIG